MILKLKNTNFHQYKISFLIDNIDVNKIVVSNKVFLGKRILNILLATKIFRPLCIFFPEMTAYSKDFDKTKCISFLIKDEKLLKKYSEIWKKVSKINLKRI